MKTKLIYTAVFPLALIFGSSAWASLDARLVGYGNGDEIIKKLEFSSPLLREESLRAAEAILILENLSQDKENRVCQLVGVDVLGHDSAEILTRTGSAFQLMRFAATKSKLVESISSEGPISHIAMSPLDSHLIQAVGDQFKMIQLRTLSLRQSNGAISPGDTYEVLKIYYAETADGFKLLKLETRSFAAEGKLMSAPRLVPVASTSGSCEPHKATPAQFK